MQKGRVQKGSSRGVERELKEQGVKREQSVGRVEGQKEQCRDFGAWSVQRRESEEQTEEQSKREQIWKRMEVGTELVKSEERSEV